MFCSLVGEFFLSKVGVASFYCKCQFCSSRTGFVFQDPWAVKLKDMQKQRGKRKYHQSHHLVKWKKKNTNVIGVKQVGIRKYLVNFTLFSTLGNWVEVKLNILFIHDPNHNRVSQSADYQMVNFGYFSQIHVWFYVQ